MTMKTTVLSLGGSIIAPDKVDTTFLAQFHEALKAYLDEDRSRRVILVCGGGAPARVYQSALRAVRPDSSPESQDWLGIRATHLNGALVRAVFSDYVEDEAGSPASPRIPTPCILRCASGPRRWSTCRT